MHLTAKLRCANLEVKHSYLIRDVKKSSSFFLEKSFWEQNLRKI